MKILFLAFHHPVRDPRLFHRQMQLLKREIEKIDLYLLNDGGIVHYDSVARGEPGDPSEPGAKSSGTSHVGRTQGVAAKLRARVVAMWRRLADVRRVYRLRPAVVQASDVREIKFALLIKVLTGSSAVYDSHEDYFNQIYEYGGGGLKALAKAAAARLDELLWLRFFDAVYCTDDFLLDEYRKPHYGCRHVHLLRNFPMQLATPGPTPHRSTTELKLVYAGSVNRFRGVAECAAHVRKYNRLHAPRRRLRLTLFARPGPLVEEVTASPEVDYGGWLDYQALINELANHDVGVCLWLRIKKLERNLPLKNFDYMAAGLPLLTSDFGNLKRYADASGAALCIDPTCFEQFESAIDTLFDPITRRTLGHRGRDYIRTHGSFEQEATSYLAFMSQLSARKGNGTRSARDVQA